MYGGLVSMSQTADPLERVFYTDNPKSLGLVKISHRMKIFTVIAQKSKLTIQNYSFTLNSIFFPLPLFRVVWNVSPPSLSGVLKFFFPSLSSSLSGVADKVVLQFSFYLPCGYPLLQTNIFTRYPLLQTANNHNNFPIVAEK